MPHNLSEIMSRHPVTLAIEPSPRIARLHVIIRLALLLALATIGCSSIYWLLYLSIPALVALLIAQNGGARYLTEDAPRIVRVLRWIAGAYGYLWLLTDVLPTAEAGGPVDLQVETSGIPTMTSALLRLVYSLPGLLLVMVLSLAAGLLWVVGAIFVLVTERMPALIADFLSLALRVQFRLIAYHLSLVDRYPSLEPGGPVVSSQSPGSI